jgi:hypothetical protein
MFHLLNIPHIFVLVKDKKVSYCKGVSYDVLDLGETFIIRLHDERRVIGSCQVKYGPFLGLRIMFFGKRLLKSYKSKKPSQAKQYETRLNSLL